jgi:acetyl esterase
MIKRWKRELGSALMEHGFRKLSWAGRLLPQVREAWNDIEVLSDLEYLPTGLQEHRLDVYRPRHRGAKPLPVVFYVHGGGFRVLSKETHWLMAQKYAQAGYVVFTINYRLAPRWKYPAALEDVFSAWQWVLSHGADFGGDVSRVVVAGESAGANLAVGLCVACCVPRSEPGAQAVFDRAVVPLGLLAKCGLHQVSDIGRFRGKGPVRAFVQSRLDEIVRDYLPDSTTDGWGLADPLLVLEGLVETERPWPATYIPCGTGDVLVSDSHRLESALLRLGADVLPDYYAGEPHAFMAFIWREAAHRCWTRTLDFVVSVTGSSDENAVSDEDDRPLQSSG